MIEYMAVSLTTLPEPSAPADLPRKRWTRDVCVLERAGLFELERNELIEGDH